MGTQEIHVLLAIASIDEKSAKELVHKLKKLGAPITSYDVRFHKSKVDEYLMVNPLTDVLIVSEELEQYKGYTTREFERLAENNPKLRIIPILTDSQKGKPYVKELINVNIYDALFNTDATLERVAKLVEHGRGRKEARYYYDIDNVEEEQDNSADIVACIRTLNKSNNKVATAKNILARVTEEEFVLLVSKLPKEIADVLVASEEEELLPYFKKEEKIGKISNILNKIKKKSTKKEVAKVTEENPNRNSLEKGGITPPIDFTVDISDVIQEREVQVSEAVDKVEVEKVKQDEWQVSNDDEQDLREESSVENAEVPVKEKISEEIKKSVHKEQRKKNKKERPLYQEEAKMPVMFGIEIGETLGLEQSEDKKEKAECNQKAMKSNNGEQEEINEVEFTDNIEQVNSSVPDLPAQNEEEKVQQETKEHATKVETAIEEPREPQVVENKRKVAKSKKQEVTKVVHTKNNEESMDSSKKTKGEFNRNLIVEDTIGVVGVKRGIGATYQAIMIARYFSNMGKSVALIEKGQSLDFALIEKSYPVNGLSESAFSYKGITFYKKNASINKVYDVLVYDYGRYRDEIRQSCMNNLELFIVTGGMAWETVELDKLVHTILEDRKESCFALGTYVLHRNLEKQQKELPSNFIALRNVEDPFSNKLSNQIAEVLMRDMQYVTEPGSTVKTSDETNNAKVYDRKENDTTDNTTNGRRNLIRLLKNTKKSMERTVPLSGKNKYQGTTGTVFVSSIRSGCGCSHIANTLAAYMAEGSDTCLITPCVDTEHLPSSVNVVQTKDISSVPEVFSRYSNVVIDAGVYSELNNSNLSECKRANMKVMVCWGGSENMRKLASFVEKEGKSAEDWFYVFNNIPSNQIKEIKKLMNFYACCFMPLYAVDELTDEVEHICKEILQK